jgi:flagellar basal-body rod protein FlgC
MSNLLSAIDASASALDAQRTRMEVAVSNLANAESVGGPNGPYRRREVVLSSQPFEASFDGSANGAVGVKVVGVLEDQSDFKRVSDPNNSNADADGFVAMPNVEVPRKWSTCSAPRAPIRPISPPSVSFAKPFNVRWSWRNNHGY